MFVEGRVLTVTTGREPILGAVIETWETDGKGERHSDVFFSFCLMAYGSQPPRIVRYAVRGTHSARVSWSAED